MKYPTITSATNPHIRKIISEPEKGADSPVRSFLIEGPHLIEMALKAGENITEAFFTGPFSGKEEGAKMINRLASAAIKLVEVSDKVMQKLAGTVTPQGIAAVVSHRPAVLDELKSGPGPLLVVLDRIQDPGNLGTIIRTADAAGSDAVLLLPPSCDPFMQKTVRSTAGSIFNIPVVQTQPERLLPFLRDRGIRLAVTSLDARDSVYDADLDGPVALVFGNEAQGVSRQLRDAADISMKVPVPGGAESLNVASAAAVCIYEAVRQRSISGQKNN